MGSRPTSGTFADLEIHILERQESGYPVEVTASGGLEFPRGFLSHERRPWIATPSPQEAGEALFGWLFESKALRSAWTEARGQNPQCRIRLRLDGPELHDLPWELLRDPSTSACLAASDSTPFSRYLAGPWRAGEEVRERPLRMLAAVAAPRGLDEYGQPSLDVDGEIDTLQRAVAAAGQSLLEMTLVEAPVSLERLQAALGASAYHILHLVAHGVYDRKDGEEGLLLVDGENRVVPVRGRRLAELLAGQSTPLRLVFLSSCESGAAAGSLSERSSELVPRGLAPYLISAGTPAVLSMQKRVAVETARTFAATFYRQLVVHGEVDRAANQARAAVLTAELPGAALPVLFMGLPSGRLFSRTEGLGTPAGQQPLLQYQDTSAPTASLPASGLHLAPGKDLLHYRIVEKLGEGAMGEIYVAEDTKLGRCVALKVLPPELASDPERLKRFRREARTVAQLNHPSIVTIHSVEKLGQLHFFTMELVEGQTLDAFIPPAGMSLGRILDIAVPLVEALVAAHEGGIVHRDLKPANVMVASDGRVKVLDFGIAKLEPKNEVEATRTLATQAGWVLGTVPYMSPEQLQGKGLDARSDIFSLGILLYEMTTAQHPFPGSSSAEVISAILREDPRALREKRPDVLPHLNQIIERCLEKTPQRRYLSARDLLGDLRELVREAESGDVVSGSSGVSRPGQPNTVGRQKERAGLPRSGTEVPGHGESQTGATAPQGSVKQHQNSIGGEGHPVVVHGRRRRALPAVALLAVVAVALVYYFDSLFSPGRAPIDSLAVLPVENLSGDPEQEYFADGMTEALINELSKIGALKVISRTSVMQYKDERKPLREIAEELGVDAVIEGAALREGNRGRVTFQLIEAATDQTLWSERYESDLSSILELQSRVARAVADRIKITVTPQEELRLAAARPINTEAYDAYLKGLYWSTRGDRMTNVREYFERALEIDPDYARAHAGLADFYLARSVDLAHTPREELAKARAAALRALELDDSLAEAYTALARVQESIDWDWVGAEARYQRAIQLNPSYAKAYYRYASLLARFERTQEALEYVESGQELDPTSPFKSQWAGIIQYFVRQYNEAAGKFEEAIELDPAYQDAYLWLSVIYLQQQEYDEFVTAYQKAMSLGGASPAAVNQLGLAYTASGMKGVWSFLIQLGQAARIRGYFPAYILALAHAGIGDREEAFAWLETAYEERDFNLVRFARTPLSGPFRVDSRFDDLLGRMNLQPQGQAGSLPGTFDR